MKEKKKIFCISAMPYVLCSCLIVTLVMFKLTQIGKEKERDIKGSCGAEVSDQPIFDNYVVLSVDITEESDKTEIKEEPIETVPAETEHIEIEEIKYPLAERYNDIVVTQYDIDLMAAVVHHESDNQCFAGQRMVAEVILNRVVQGDMGGTTIRDVIYAKNQFFYVTDVDIARANETNYQAVYAALNETPITDEDVVYFALSPHNNSVFAKVGDHYFCRKW